MEKPGPQIRAFTRPVPDSINCCELTHIGRLEIDIGRARSQHAAYEDLLGQLGCVVQPLPAAHDLPDSVFIEDTAVVFDEIAIVARPAVPVRQRETEAVAAALAGYRPLAAISAPGTLDGGDVLQLGHDVYVGVSGRTNSAGVRQLAEIVSPYGYRVHPVETSWCLHLKSAATTVGEDLVIVNPDWVDGRQFGGVRMVAVDPGEPFAANILRVRDTLLCATSAPNTRIRLERQGLDVRTVDLSELAKAEGALTCCSLILRG